MLEHSPLKTYPTLGPAGEASLDLNTSYAQILRLIEGPAKIADFGCGPGNLARLLSQRDCTVVGIDINPEHASIAREYCKDVLVADLEEVSLLKLFPSERFDIAIFADILEHLRDPDQLLAQVHRILAPGGVVLASIPNVAHGAMRLSLLKGDFDYQPLGLLDDTHIRFFTKKNALAMFDRNGFIVDSVTRTTARLFDPSCGLVPHVERADFSDDIIARISEDPEVETLQFIVRAVPANSAEARYAAARQIISSLEERVTNLTRELEDARAHSAVTDPNLPTLAHHEEVLARLHVATSAAEEAQKALEKANAELVVAVKERDAALAIQADLGQRLASAASASADEQRAEQARAVETKARFDALTSDLAAARRAMKNAQAHIRELLRDRNDLRDALGGATSREEQLCAALADVTEEYTTFRGDVTAELRILGDAAAQSTLELSLREAELRKAEDVATYAREAALEKQERLEHVQTMLDQQIRRVATLEQQRSSLEEQLVKSKVDESALVEISGLYEAAERHRAELSAALESLRVQHLKLVTESQDAALGAAREHATLRTTIERNSEKLAAQDEALADRGRHLAEVAARLHMAINSVIAKDRHIQTLETSNANYESVILEMRGSKFWAARNAWFALKQFLAGQSKS